MIEGLDVERIKEYLKDVPENTKLYIGCDSDRYKNDKVWFADYALVLVVHKAGNNGCKIFGDVITERDYDQKQDKPAMRLMNEVYKVAEFYIENFEIFDGFETEIHIDINPDEQYGSSCVVTQAVGYIKGACGITPKVKPDAPMASCAADRLKSIRFMV